MFERAKTVYAFDRVTIQKILLRSVHDLSLAPCLLSTNINIQKDDFAYTLYGCVTWCKGRLQATENRLPRRMREMKTEIVTEGERRLLHGNVISGSVKSRYFFWLTERLPAAQEGFYSLPLSIGGVTRVLVECWEGNVEEQRVNLAPDHLQPLYHTCHVIPQVAHV
jgi:hypothetical protein